jgi:hypothetical protein
MRCCSHIAVGRGPPLYAGERWVRCACCRVDRRRNLHTITAPRRIGFYPALHAPPHRPPGARSSHGVHRRTKPAPGRTDDDRTCRAAQLRPRRLPPVPRSPWTPPRPTRRAAEPISPAGCPFVQRAPRSGRRPNASPVRMAQGGERHLIAPYSKAPIGKHRLTAHLSEEHRSSSAHPVPRTAPPCRHCPRPLHLSEERRSTSADPVPRTALPRRHRPRPLSE